jgi:hypothetical protein
LKLTLLGKPGCVLCHEMGEVVRRVVPQGGWLEKDVRSDPELERRYLLEIPVLLLGDVEVARHRTSEVELRERLAAAGFSC